MTDSSEDKLHAWKKWGGGEGEPAFVFWDTTSLWDKLCFWLHEELWDGKITCLCCKMAGVVSGACTLCFRLGPWDVSAFWLMSHLKCVLKHLPLVMAWTVQSALTAGHLELAEAQRSLLGACYEVTAKAVWHYIPQRTQKLIFGFTVPKTDTLGSAKIFSNVSREKSGQCGIWAANWMGKP